MALNLRRVFVITLLTMIALPLAATDSGRKRTSSPAPKAPTKQSFNVNQLEYYMSDDGIAYIRPGLKLKVNSVNIGSDKKAVVDLTLTDNFDQPLDRLGKVTPGSISISCILAWYNPATRQYTSYVTRTATAAAPSPTPGVKALQATADSGGNWTDWETGHSSYVFKTALPDNFDSTKTHTLAIYATRDLTQQIGKSYYANVEYDFRPDGQKVTETWDKINAAASCNNCHNPLAMHGGSRQDPKLCATCHQPQSVDPDTGNTVDLKVMVHKIHNGPNLPSFTQGGKPYQIIGYGQAISDFSKVTYPQDVRRCANCHEGTNAAAKPTQSQVYLTNPSRDACGSCHDDVNWTTGENHPAGPQANDIACATCHVPDSGQEFDASIKGAHTIPERSKQLKGLSAEIVSVSNFAAGKKPTVVFKIKNGDGSAVDGTKISTFSPMISGPTSSYASPIRESAVKTAVFDATAGTSTYTFTAAIPADASGTWVVSADIYRTVTLKRADGKADITGVREAVMNPIKYVAISGPLTPRRAAVTTAQCNSCHDKLALHGGQRQTTEECVICHNPTADDSGSRPTTEGTPESISLQRLAHRIHTGEELTQEFTIYGHGNSKNTFNEVTFPGDRRDCAKCHTSNAYTLPLPTGIASVITKRDYFSPQGPATASCLGCHDNSDAAAHAYLNSATFPGASTPSEACATCHGTGKDWDVAKVHAR